MSMRRKEALPHRARRIGVRWRLALVVAAIVPLLAPAAGHALASWQAVDAGAPTGAHLRDVAAATSASGPIVVAVGDDGTNGIVYRLSHGAWTADQLPAGTGPLTDVVLAGSQAHVAYALGPQTLVRLDDADGTGAWAAITGLPAGPLTALAFAPDGTSGLVGAADGRIYSFAPDTNGFTAVNDVNGQVTPPAGQIAGLAATAPGTGFAVTLGAAPNPRFLALSPSSVPQPQVGVEPADGATCGDLEGVAATESSAVAVDARCWWNLVDGTWRRHGPFTEPGAALDDIALSGTVTTIAGSAKDHGVVWRRSGTGDFVLDPAVAPGALHAVAIVGPEDMWAVGEGGAVRHYAVAPPAPVGDGGTDDGGTADGATGDGAIGDGATDSGSSSTGGQGSTTGSSTSQSPSTPDGFHIDIEDHGSGTQSSGPDYSTTGIDTGNGSKRPAHRRKPAPTRRLLSNVKVRAAKHGLVIEFDLAAPASVAIAASRGKRNLGVTKPRVFKSGHVRILLRYRGAKAPTNLKITARRSTKAGAPAQPSAGKQRGDKQ
jgi:hypothetical protein